MCEIGDNMNKKMLIKTKGGYYEINNNRHKK